MATQCTHIPAHLKNVRPRTRGCEECLKTGDSWVHLRMCLECGHIGCCASSPAAHAISPANSVIQSVLRTAVRPFTQLTSIDRQLASGLR